MHDWIELIERQDLATLQTWIDKDPDEPLLRDEFVMQAAVREGCSEIISMLVEQGASVAGTLQEAVTVGELPLLRFLVDHGADINLANSAGLTPLHVLANRDTYFANMGSNLYFLLGDVEETEEDEDTQKRLSLLEWFLEQGAAVNIPVGDPGLPGRNYPPKATALDIAEITRSRILADRLKEAGARHSSRMTRHLLFRFLSDVENPGGQERFRSLFAQTRRAILLQNDEGESLLHLAVRFGLNAEILWLLEQGADINTRTSNNSSAPPLVYALFGMSEGRATLNTLKTVLEAGADTSIFSSPGLTPVAFLTLLARQIRQPELALEMLLERGADAIRPLMVQGDATPIELAAMQAGLPWRYFELLLERGADPERISGDGANLLHKLMLQSIPDELRANRLETMTRLLALGLDPNQPTTSPIVDENLGLAIPEGATVLDIAMMRGQEEVWELLQNAGGTTFLLEEDDFSARLLGEEVDDSALILQALEEDSQGSSTLQRIELLVQLERYEEALEALDDLPPEEAEQDNLRLLKAQLLAQCGHFHESLSFVSRYLANNPEEGYAFLLRGSILFELQRFDEAIVSFEQGQLLAPELMDAELLSVLGAAYMNQGNFSQAVLALDEALELDPDGLDPEVRGWQRLARLALDS
jgi:ankyrin repeat protein